MKSRQEEKGENLNDLQLRQFLKTVAVVAAPIALQSLIGSSLNLVDNLMIGHLGEIPLNAVGVSVQIFFRVLDVRLRLFQRGGHIHFPVLRRA